MEIERLKELKGITEQLYQDSNVPLNYCDVLELIDEAIARKSVTSEDVAEAIGLLSGKSYGTHNLSCDCVFCKAIGLAITALQAYQPTISKTETTSCEWCKGVVGEFFDVLWYDFVNRKRGNVNYCPNCGRRLEEKNHGSKENN